MTPPPTIPFSSIDFGSRARSTYPRIMELAQSIFDHGLIQPLVLSPMSNGESEFGSSPTLTQLLFGLDAGGRRYRALELLLQSGQWDGILHHGATSQHHPLVAGYILKGELFATPLQRLMTELAENLDREEMDWRDNTRLIVKAWNLARTEAHAESRDILMRDGGAMLGCGYMDLKAAVIIHDDLLVNPERYRDVPSIRAAHTKLLKINEQELTKVLMSRTLATATPTQQSPIVSDQADPKPSITNIPLTTAFGCCDSLEYMRGLSGPTFDHIVTDPDYAISVEQLEANMDTHAGVNQDTVEASLSNLQDLLREGFRIIRDKGFLVFWFDITHFEHLMAFALSIGWRVQRWPLIWYKTDYRSNASPQSNFCKNYEVAMVCRKPGAVLARPQMSSIYSCASNKVGIEFGHPFAKPLEVSRWIYSAIAIKGQSVYDPFMGTGSLSIAAIEWGLKASGSEINPDHYARAIMNLQRSFTKLVGGEVTFS